MPQHSWTFLVTGDNNNSIATVCTACGLMRRKGVRDERHLDLRGECPGEPANPDDDPKSPPAFVG